jgi:hypothetical protein
MVTSIAIAFVVGTAVTAGWLRLVSRLTGTKRIPTSDLLIITGLCSALALFPRAGWILAIIFMALLTSRVEQLDPWPEVVLMVGGSAFLWLFMSAAVMSILS